MNKRIGFQRSSLCAVALLLACSGIGLGAKPSVHVSEHEVPLLEIRPVGLAVAPAESPGPWRVEVDPDEGGRVDFEVRWPDGRTGVKIQVRAEERLASPGAGHRIGLEAVVEFADGRRVRSEREMSFDERTTVLFEVFRDVDRSLTLAVAASIETRTVFSHRPTAGRPLAFGLEIQRVEAGRTISLETNLLRTLVGESVSYFFDLGGADAESVRVQLTPLRIIGEIIEIDAELSGKLPDADDLQIIGRKEHWVTSRGATSTLAFEFGEPPTGYRFLVTPQY